MNTTTTVAFEKPVTLRESVESFLRESIMQGRLRGGERLREQELCEQLGVSRSTLREALRRLEAERLITIEPHRGPRVTQMSEKEARDLYALRVLLEGYAAHEFALRASEGQIARLGKEVQSLHAAARTQDKAGLLHAKQRFYDVLLEGCDNRLMSDMLIGLLSRISLLRATSFSQPDRLPQSLDEIDRIFHCIQRRDAEGAQHHARIHVTNAEQAALAMLSGQQERRERTG
jgi:DNA-binding GntR family transcriptional regulator